MRSLEAFLVKHEARLGLLSLSSSIREAQRRRTGRGARLRLHSRGCHRHATSRVLPYMKIPSESIHNGHHVMQDGALMHGCGNLRGHRNRIFQQV